MKIKLTSVFVDDQEKALEFYTDVLGFVVKHDFPVGQFKWLTVVSPEEPEGAELLLEPSDNPAAQTFKKALFDQAIAAAAFAQGTSHGIIALNGAVLQMFNHGLSAAGMFFLVGVIYERTHTRDLNEYGGLFPLVPVYGGILIFTSMASLGLPGLNGFISEFLVVRGAWGVGVTSWSIFTVLTGLSMLGLLFTGAYILKGIKQVLHGPMNKAWVGHLTEINFREIVVMAPLMVLMLVIGVWPVWILEVINWAMVTLFGA